MKPSGCSSLSVASFAVSASQSASQSPLLIIDILIMYYYFMAGGRLDPFSHVSRVIDISSSALLQIILLEGDGRIELVADWSNI